MTEFLSEALTSAGHQVLLADDSARGLALTKQHSPDLALVDIEMPAGQPAGLELLKQIKEYNHSIAVVMMTGVATKPRVVAALRGGAHDFIEKPFKENELQNLVEKMLVTARNSYKEASLQKNNQSLLSKLTGRERQVLERIVAGRLNKQIADDLTISIKTVEAHRANIMEKLNVSTVADLLRLALSEKI